MKKILQLILLICTTHTTFSQAPNDYYNRMDHVFGAIDKNKVNTGLLKEFGISFSDLSIHNGTLTSQNHVDATTWSSLYQSLYTMQAGSTITMTSPEAISNLWTNTQDANPTKIILAAYHYEYQQYKSNAYSNGDVNVVNDRIYDVAGRNPYETKQVVAFASKNFEVSGNSFVFRLPSNLFFNQSGKTLQSISIDFGNGQGYQPLTTDTDKIVSYSSGGEKTLKLLLQYTDNSNYYSQSKIKVHYFSTAGRPYNGADFDTTIVASKSYQGIAGSAEINVEYAGNDGVLDKPLIVVEGFDFTDDFTYEDFYDDDELGGILIELDPANPNYTLNDAIEAEGYDVVFVNYDNGTDFIQRNAYMLESVIEWVNEQKEGVSTAEPNVILGMSMGGLVARYALRDMELNGIDHDTKLYISHDSPHQGANVPVSYQAFVRHLAGEQIGIPVLFSTLTQNIIDLEDAIEGLSEGMELLNSPAAQQMLIYQLEGTGDNIIHSNNKVIRNTFLSEYQSMGMPQANGIRNIAISNGAECGTKIPFPDNAVIAEMDSTIDLNFWIANVGLSVLNGLSVNPVKSLTSFTSFNTDIKIQFKMRALPNQEVKEIYRGKIFIKKKVLGFINVEEPLINEVNFNSTSDMLALDNSAGGIFNVEELFDVPAEFGDLIREPEFSFIPTYSSLDLGNGNQQILASDLTRILSPIAPPTGAKTIPFDNFITNPNASEDHIKFIPQNGEWLLAELQGTNAFYSCASACVTPIPLNISGTSVVCTSSSTFNLNNIPAGAIVNWSVSNSNIISISSSSNNQVQVQWLGGFSKGKAYVKATVETGCGNFEVLSDEFWAGTPKMYVYDENFEKNYSGQSYQVPFNSGAHQISVLSDTEVTYTWDASPTNLIWTSNGNQFSYLTGASGTFVATATAENDCGLSNFFNVLQIGTSGGMMMVYPNPTSDELYLEWPEEEASKTTKASGFEYQLSIHDKNGRQVYNKSHRSKKKLINLKHLKKGHYILSVKHKNEISNYRLEKE